MCDPFARVEMMGVGAETKKGLYLKQLHDEAKDRYFSPVVLDPAAPAGNDRSAIAVMDTGLLTRHPYIAPRLEQSVDFTGEGIDDRNGHGTTVALQALEETAAVSFLNVKIMDARGRGKEDWLIAGLDWCTDWVRRDGRKLICNLSAGLFHRRWGLFPCKGNCALGDAAARADEAGVFLVMAAGNSGPSTPPCPQQGAIRELYTGLVVASLLRGTKIPTVYSGPSNTGFDEQRLDEWHPVV